MTLKRILLIVLTALAVAKVFFSLVFSLNQPQVQGRLQLYQTNLVLQATEFQVESHSTEQEFPTELLLGKNPYLAAQKQYEEAEEEVDSSLAQLQEQLTALVAMDSGTSVITLESSSIEQEQRLQAAVQEMQELQAELALNKGILQVKQGKISEAGQTWQQVAPPPTVTGFSATAQVLSGLWTEAPLITPDAETLVQTNLEGWFQQETLSQLYRLQGNSTALASLVQARQQAAEEALGKLLIIGGIPALGGILGVSIMVVLVVQFFLQKERSLLTGNNTPLWETPWDGETIWQVLIVGFFFISQILLPEFLPLIINGLGLDPFSFSLREKAFYVLMSYTLMMIGGLTVLYISLKSFFPLPVGWFRFQFFSKWPLWGIGGYLVAIPLVVLVSLVNQRIWQGQGGSNPIILLALQSQDTLALILFFTTASLAAPLFEEIMFRGFLLPSLTRYMPLWGAIGVSSVVFAVAHLSLSEVLPLTVLGMVLGFVYARSQNLLSSILLHSLWNSGTLLSLFVLGNK